MLDFCYHWVPKRCSTCEVVGEEAWCPLLDAEKWDHRIVLAWWRLIPSSNFIISNNCARFSPPVFHWSRIFFSCNERFKRIYIFFCTHSNHFSKMPKIKLFYANEPAPFNFILEKFEKWKVWLRFLDSLMF